MDQGLRDGTRDALMAAGPTRIQFHPQDLAIAVELDAFLPQELDLVPFVLPFLRQLSPKTPRLRSFTSTHVVATRKAASSRRRES
jgi:hypothetical protein